MLRDLACPVLTLKRATICIHKTFYASDDVVIVSRMRRRTAVNRLWFISCLFILFVSFPLCHSAKSQLSLECRTHAGFGRVCSSKYNNKWVLVSVLSSVTRKKSPNVYKSCPKMISLEKLLILTPLQKLPKNVEDLGKFYCCQKV